jgi:hypothetical protein
LPDTIAPTLFSPTKSPTCCRAVNGGSVQNAECDFGTDSWSYVSPGTREDGLTSCVSIDDLPPRGAFDMGLGRRGLKWCPTKIPAGLSGQDAYNFNSNWALCECPCEPSPSPTTAIPTTNNGEFSKIALFIQADHSGSIRSANPKCKSLSAGDETGSKTCWQLQTQFIQNLVNYMAGSVGSDNFRLYLSAFSCINGNPTNKVLSNPVLSWPGHPEHVQTALRNFAVLGERRMYGTCPSLGTETILDTMKRLPTDWPIAYVIITDGRIDGADQRNFATTISKVKKRMGSNRVCAATVGYDAVDQIRHLLRSDCVHPASDFIEIATSSFSSRLGHSLLIGGDDLAIPTQVTQPPQNSQGSQTAAPNTAPAPDETPNEPSSPHSSEFNVFSTVVGSSIGVVIFVGLFFVFAVSRRRRRHVIRGHKPADEVFWINNPKPVSPKSGPTIIAPMRRRSRASSDVSLVHLPAPPDPVLLVNEKTPESQSQGVDSKDIQDVRKRLDFNQQADELPRKNVDRFGASNKTFMSLPVDTALSPFSSSAKTLRDVPVTPYRMEEEEKIESPLPAPPRIGKSETEGRGWTKQSRRNSRDEDPRMTKKAPFPPDNSQ